MPAKTPTERRMKADGESFGIRQLVGIPLHGPLGVTHGISLASRHRMDLKKVLPVMNLLAVQFHQIYLSMHPPSLPPAPSLTPREREILQWCAAGESNWDIGGILGISAHAVDFHLRNVFRKLQVSDRVTAVLKALASGAIKISILALTIIG